MIPSRVSVVCVVSYALQLPVKFVNVHVSLCTRLYVCMRVCVRLSYLSLFVCIE